MPAAEKLVVFEGTVRLLPPQDKNKSTTTAPAIPSGTVTFELTTPTGFDSLHVIELSAAVSPTSAATSPSRTGADEWMITFDIAVEKFCSCAVLHQGTDKEEWLGLPEAGGFSVGTLLLPSMARRAVRVAAFPSGGRTALRATCQWIGTHSSKAAAAPSEIQVVVLAQAVRNHTRANTEMPPRKSRTEQRPLEDPVQVLPKRHRSEETGSSDFSVSDEEETDFDEEASTRSAPAAGLPPVPEWFKDPTASYFVEQSLWNTLWETLPEVDRAVLDFDVIFSSRKNPLLIALALKTIETIRKKHFVKQIRNGSKRFGDGWKNPITKETIIKIFGHLTHRLRYLPQCEALTFDGQRKIFWTSMGRKKVRCRLRLFKGALFPPLVSGDGRKAPLWDHFTDDNEKRVAVMRGCSGTGKTMSLLHHTHPDVVVFYLHLPEMLPEKGGKELPLEAGRKQLDPKTRRNKAVTKLVVDAVLSLLGKAVSPGTEDKVLIAVDEGGGSPEFARGFCAASEDIVRELRAKCFRGDTKIPIRLAIAGTGVETSDLKPASDDTTYFLVEPCPEVWDHCCASNERVASVLPLNPEASHTPLQRMVRGMVGNARAAAVLARVVLRSKVRIRPDSDRHLIYLGEQATEILLRLNGLRYVKHEELAAIFVHATFLQGRKKKLTPDDFNVVRRFGVLVDTTPRPGADLPMDPLRRYLMPDVFSAWLHFLVRFGLKNTAGDDFEETVAEFVSLGLVAPQQQSYFRAKYWALLDARLGRAPDFCWRHPFALFDFISTLRGRELQKGCTLIRLTSRFAAKRGNGLIPGGKEAEADAETDKDVVMRLTADGRFGTSQPHLQALASELTVELPLDRDRHTVVMNGPQAPFADLMIFPRGNITDETDRHTFAAAKPRPAHHVILVQCKGSTAQTPKIFTAFDLFVELYKMGCDHPLSHLAHVIDVPPPVDPTAPATLLALFEDAFDSVDACVLAALVRKGFSKTDTFAVAMAIMRESKLTAAVLKDNPAFEEQLLRLHAWRQATDVQLLQILTGIKPVVPALPKPSIAASATPSRVANPAPIPSAPGTAAPKTPEEQQLIDHLERAIAERKALINEANALKNGGAPPDASDTKDGSPFVRALRAVWKTLLRSPNSAAAAEMKPFFKLTTAPTGTGGQQVTGRALSRVQWKPNPNALLLQALEIAHECRYEVKRVVVVWKREVEDISQYCVPPDCKLFYAEPWTDSKWPPTNLYPLVEHTSRLPSEGLLADCVRTLPQVLNSWSQSRGS